MITKITEFTRIDISALATIWLTENISAHDFIDEKYWLDNLPYFKSAITKVDVWVDEEADQITGFIGINDNYIEGIFVTEEYQHQGIGKKLLSEAKNNFDHLTLHVYQNNQAAIEFYLGQNFVKTGTNIDENTNQVELEMSWNKLQNHKYQSYNKKSAL
ncbi:GNAT family N-acetyltransferase [Companilactobacillus furfuricola]|uniref:GNAT family N-acetyltransferase n=1 Tax=Companilactobacillus furfuricola TaxID=1462575 RepID=UPI0013DE487E|nr:GNAT family N-acetyltransferase [Companilactobacillus furfuricola]